MRILITGGAGFIGRHLAQRYSGKAEVTILDNGSSGSLLNLKRLPCTIIEGSVLDKKLVNQAVEGVDCVFHLAAFVSAADSVNNPRDCLNLNITGLRNVLEESSKAGVGKLLFASSAAVYGENPESPKRESMMPSPGSPYALTKVIGEQLCEFFHREKKMGTACFRFFNVFGPGQNPKGPYAAVIPRFVTRALKGESLQIYGDGRQTRDFIYVLDVVEALVLGAACEAMTGVFNVGWGYAISINSLAKKVLKLTGSSAGLIYGKSRSGEVGHSVASVAKLLRSGWKPKISLNEGLELFINNNKSGRQEDT